MTSQSRIQTLYLSQEDLLRAGCLDMGMAMEVAEQAMLAFRNDEILFPEKIVQIFNQDTQERINCLPATLLAAKNMRRQMGFRLPREPRETRRSESLCDHHPVRDRKGVPHRLAGRNAVLEHAGGGHGRHRRQALRPPGFGDHCVHRGGRAGQNASGGDEEGGTINRGMPGCIEVRARGEAVRG